MTQPKTRNKIIEALLALAAELRWEEVTLPVLAERAGISLTALRSAYDGRVAVLADFVRRTDERVLAAMDPEIADEAPRERLFDVLFSRFEALAPHRAAIGNIGRAARRDPLLALELNGIVTNSMVWMLAAAGIPSTGRSGLIKAQGLTFVWARVMRVWLNDTDAGLARTMAELDKQLRRAERNMMRLDRIAGVLRRSGRAGGRRRTGKRAGESDASEGHPS